MEVTLFGIIWSIILIFAGFRSKKALIKCVIFSGLFQAGAILIVDDAVVTPLTFSCLTYILFGLIGFCRQRRKITIPRFFIAFFIMWIVILCSAILSSLLFKGVVVQQLTGRMELVTEVYQGDISLYGFAELLLYGITAVFIFNEKAFVPKDFDKLIDCEFWFVLIVGVWQIITLMGIIPRISLIENLVYSNTATNSMAYYNQRYFSGKFSQYRFYSSFMEPSYSGGFLGAIFYHYLSRFARERHDFSNALKAILTFVMIIITYSTTAYAVTVLAVLIVVAQQLRDIKKIVRISFVGILILVVSYLIINNLGLWEKIIRQSIEKMDTGSAEIRGTWNDACIQVFKDTLGIGIGYGNIFGSSFAFTLLGSMGILGSLSYLVFIISVLRKRPISPLRCSIPASVDTIKFKTILIICIAAQMVAVGRFNYSVFWMFLFTLMAAYATSDSITARKGISEKASMMTSMKKDHQVEFYH